MGLRETILELLASDRMDAYLGDGHTGFFADLRGKFGQKYNRVEALEEFEAMVGAGLIFIDFWQAAPANWRLGLTKKGKQVLKSKDDFEPYDPDGYMSRLKGKIPDVDEVVLLYCKESLRCFNSKCYLAASVMLGVASEKAFLLLAEAFAQWLPNNQSEKLISIIRNPRENFITKFLEFRKRIEPHKPVLPEEFADNMALNLDSVGDLIRIYRNESGHPTGKRVEKGDAYINLHMFAIYLQKIYNLRRFFLSNKKP